MLSKVEFLDPFVFKHDTNARKKHKLTVEVLVKILRLHRNKITFDSWFALQNCDVYDQTTNILYEIEQFQFSKKRKMALENYVIIPINKVECDYKMLMKYIFEFLKSCKILCL